MKTKQKNRTKILTLLLLTCAMLLLSACNEERVNSSYYVIEDVVQIPEEKEEEELLTADKTIFKLFYPDETGQVMLTKSIEVEEISKITIIEHIQELGYLSENTRLIKLTGEELEDGSRLLLAEFSEELRQVIVEKEEKEGQIVFGCIVNTILDAYDASGIRILAGNEVLEIPMEESILEMNESNVPEGYYTSFALTHAKNKIKEVQIQGEMQTITYEQFYSEEGYSIFYEKENYANGYNEEDGHSIFESLDFTTRISIYISESSRTDTVQMLMEQSELGSEELAEIVETKIGVEEYEAIGVYKNESKWEYNYYVIEKESQVFVIEVRMNQEVSDWQGEHIAYMLETFRIW